MAVVLPQLPAQLQTLHYDGCYSLLPGLAATLAALPHLTSLTVVIDTQDRDSDQCYHERMTAALAAMAGHLTCLTCENLMASIDVASCFGSPTILSKLSNLRRLDVTLSKLDDAGLHTLTTSFPALTHVKVGSCELQSSHLHEVGCSSWEELGISHADLLSLARLPLRGIKRVRVGCLSGTKDSSLAPTNSSGAAAGLSAVAAFTAALAAAPDCTFAACFFGDFLTLELHVSEMPAMLPLAANLKDVGCLGLRTPGKDSQQLTPAAVKALGALLEELPSCTELHICGLKPHPSVQLLPVLARTSVTSIHLVDYGITEAELMAWCAGGDAARVVDIDTQGAWKIPADVRRSIGDVPGVRLGGCRAA
jgi:hypothetical protein